MKKEDVDPVYYFTDTIKVEGKRKSCSNNWWSVLFCAPFQISLLFLCLCLTCSYKYPAPTFSVPCPAPPAPKDPRGVRAGAQGGLARVRRRECAVQAGARPPGELESQGDEGALPALLAAAARGRARTTSIKSPFWRVIQQSVCLIAVILLLPVVFLFLPVKRCCPPPHNKGKKNANGI